MTSNTKNIYAVPQWMNKKYFETILRKQEQDDQLVLTHLTFREGNAAGENYFSSTLRVTVCYVCGSDGGVDKSKCFFVKIYDLDNVFGEFLNQTGLFDREHEVYKTVFPEMNKVFRDSWKIGPVPVGCKDIRCLVLEDLSEAGYKTINRSEQLDLAHSLSALRHLAKFHAGSVALMRKDAEFTEKFQQRYFIPKNATYIDFQFRVPLLCLSATVSTWSGYEQYANKIEDLSIRVVDQIVNFYRNTNDKFSVLMHGDFWTANIMYKYREETQEIADVKLVDYQMSAVGNPVLDLQYFLFTSPCEDVRDNHMDEMIEEYYNTLKSELSLVECGDCDYSLQQLKEDLEKTAAYGFMIASAALPFLLTDTKDALRRFSVTPEDPQVVEAQSNSRFVDNYKKLLLYFDKKGVFQE